tara:strand:+ start:1175 stop:1555 length:381 start_codon:yes stop_codon:yes gene_type:complete
MIKEMPIQELRSHSVEILSRTFLELGQNPNEDTIVSMSLILAEDLSKDFNNMEIQDVQEAFRLGIRNTDIFHITVKTYYKWIKDHRQMIWNNESIEPQMQDKRLRYRSRNGTGLNRIDINKIKLLK